MTYTYYPKNYDKKNIPRNQNNEGIPHSNYSSNNSIKFYTTLMVFIKQTSINPIKLIKTIKIINK